MAKPDDYAFYAYKGNKEAHSLDGSTWANDWDTVTSGNASTYTNFSGMYPGQTYFFALAMDTVEGNTVSLTLDSLVSNTIIDQKGSNTYHRYVTKTNGWDCDVNIGWAMNIYVFKTTALSGYSSFITNPASNGIGGDKFTYSTAGTAVTVNSTYVGHNSSDYLYGTTNSTTKVITLNTSKSLYNAAATSSKTVLYYAVQYDESQKYNEVASNSSVIDVIDANRLATNVRYFVSNASGTNNCFADLKFQLVGLTLDF